MRRKPEVVLIEVIEGDGKVLGDIKGNGFHLFPDQILFEMVRLNNVVEMIHPQSDHSVTTWGAVDFPLHGTFRAPRVAALSEAFGYDEDPILKVVGHGFDDLIDLFIGIVFCGIDPLGHGFDIVSIALIKSGTILLLRIERILLYRQVSPLSVPKDGPAELDQTGINRRLRPWSEEISAVQFLHFCWNSGFPGLKRMDMAPIQDDTANDTRMGFRNKKRSARGNGIRHNLYRVSIEGERSSGGLCQHMKKGSPEAEVFLPFRMGG
jgi:hypothetical protein